MSTHHKSRRNCESKILIQRNSLLPNCSFRDLRLLRGPGKAGWTRYPCKVSWSSAAVRTRTISPSSFPTANRVLVFTSRQSAHCTRHNSHKAKTKLTRVQNRCRNRSASVLTHFLKYRWHNRISFRSSKTTTSLASREDSQMVQKYPRAVRCVIPSRDRSKTTSRTQSQKFSTR